MTTLKRMKGIKLLEFKVMDVEKPVNEKTY